MSESDTFQNRSEKEIFFEALDKNTPEERAAFLDEACGKNPALRARVDCLLADHFQQDAFMKKAAVEGERATIRVSPIEEVAGTLVGRYKLLQQIGEGGCGVVYMAEQEEPVRRRVALKVIKLGMDTKQVIARFEAERQALALMDHPNIAKVLDAGATETGRPYFVMELVKGIPITRYCDEKNLSMVARLGVFVQVCHAIQHAHQKGIIHRDIKPSNILIADHDGVLVPKIIDFGIAKATTDQRLTDKTLFTAFEQFIGTPAYMSPEQANLSGLDIDTRSDIYSLGVLLYELLTGKTPFDAKRLIDAGLDEIRRIIKEEEPARPSTKLHTLDVAEQTTVAKHRQSDPPKLAYLISGDLDWIVMKALEKDRGRRYETANGLARDIQRHLASEPVVARPPSNSYRLQKMVRRNKVVFAAASAVALALFAGLAFSTWSFVRERQANAGEITERRKADEQRQRAEANAAIAQKQRKNAEEQRQKAEASTSTAQQQTKRAEAREAEAHRLLYVANMNLAQQAWEQNNIARLKELLHETQAFPERGFEWYYWQRQTHLALLTLKGHRASITSAAYSPDGRRIVTGSADTTAKVWDAATGRDLLTLEGHHGTIASVDFSPDGQRIVTGSHDDTAKVWDAASGKELATLKGHSNIVSSVTFSPDGQRIATAAWDGTAKIWDVASDRELFTITDDTVQIMKGQAVQVNSVAFSPDGQRIVTGSGGQTELWDATSGRKLLAIKEFTTSVAFSPDGQRIVTGNFENIAKLWDAANGNELVTFKGHGEMITSVAFSPDGQRVVTSSADGTAKLWDAAGGQDLLTIKGHSDQIWSVSFSPDGQHIVTGSYDGTAKVWAATGDEGVAAINAASKVSHLDFPIAFSKDGKRIVTSKPGGSAKLWDADSGLEVLALKDTNIAILSVAISQDGQRIVTGSGRRAVIWDATSGREVLVLKDTDISLIYVALSPDGHQILTRGNQGPAKVWDVSSGRDLFNIKADTNWDSSGVIPFITSMSFSPDSRRIITVTMNQTAEVCEAASGQELFTLKTQDGNGILSLAFSPDGKRLVTGSYGRTAKVWDATGGQELFTITGHADQISSVAFSPDGKRIATGSKDQTAKLWDAAGGRELLTLKGHNGEVSCVTFSPDGRRILTASADKTAKLWDATTGRELLTFKGHNADVSFVAFSPNGQWIVTGQRGNAEKVWAAAHPEQVAQWQAEEVVPEQH